MSAESFIVLIYINLIWLGLILLPQIIFAIINYSSVNEAIYYNKTNVKLFVVFWLLSNVAAIFIMLLR